MNKPMKKLLKISQFDMVGLFHKKFGLPTADTQPLGMIDNDAFKFREGFLQEELDELGDAHYAGDLAGVADALADLVYVALGTAHMYGIPFDKVFEVVHAANMKKVRAASAMESKRSSQLDVVKPAGWLPPDVGGVLRRKTNA